MKRRTQLALWLGAGVAAGLGLCFVPHQSLVAFFVTPDQQADWFFRHGRFVEAAARYTDPLRQGVAWYRAAEFESAARAFASAPGPDGAFNEGNASLMAGAYDRAIAAYARALALQPGWTLALENRELAMARRDRVKQEGDEVTDGQLEADDSVVDLNRTGRQDRDTDAGAPMSDADLDALWLRRVQTTPGDFLRAKFAYQAAPKGRAP